MKQIMGRNDTNDDDNEREHGRNRKRSKKNRRDDDDDEDSEEESRRGRKHREKKRRDRSVASEDDDYDRRKRRRRRESEDDTESADDEEDSREDDRKRRHRSRRERKKKHSKTKRSKHSTHSRAKKSKKKRRRDESESDRSNGDSSSINTDSSGPNDQPGATNEKVVNERLLAKLLARGETLEERKARRAEKRAAYITAKFGYTAEDNPFNDPNIGETFTWKKREEKKEKSKEPKSHSNTIEEIEKVRQRRKERELQLQEMERIRAEESRMKELENYDEWAQKEEEFHLQQQRQRSAIRLVEGREKPIDVLAKNLLLFGLSEEEKQNRAAVKYQEKYNALKALESLDAELEDPCNLLKMLKLVELEELLTDIDAFRRLEREAAVETGGFGQEGSHHHVMLYWDNLRIVSEDEIMFLKSGGKNGDHAKMARDIQKIFEGQSMDELIKMQAEVRGKLNKSASVLGMDGEAFDRQYWQSVEQQLTVHLAKMQLSELHEKMLVRQLERLEQRKEELETRPAEEIEQVEADHKDSRNVMPENVEPGFGDMEEELGLANEVETMISKYSWQDKYRPRKPRYFNRVRTGYDWNKYNQTHYDKDNPPPKTVQGYKFNIFYPDLIDPTKTPQFFLEPADSPEFCIIRFKAGPPYEDVAFKIINREWNRSRKRGFKSTFERGVLSLYFNFTTHWYRR